MKPYFKSKIVEGPSYIKKATFREKNASRMTRPAFKQRDLNKIA